MSERARLVALDIGILSMCAIICAVFPSWSGHRGLTQWIWLILAISYPLVLAWRFPKVRLLRGTIHFLVLFLLSQICNFIAYLGGYAFYQWHRLGSAPDAFHLTWLNLNESAAFFVALDLLPALLSTLIFYSIAVFASRLILRSSHDALQTPQ